MTDSMTTTTASATAPLFCLAPHRSRAHVLILFRSFHADSNPQCHVGLGVCAMHSVRILRRNGVDAHAFGVWTVDHIRQRLLAYPETTHCVLEAPWVSTADTQKLMHDFPRVHFIVRAHSQIGFLQVEAGAIRILRELLELQDLSHNLSVAANSSHLKNFFEATYAARCLYLPNLYDLDRPPRKSTRVHADRVLRIASLGALRLLKNHTTSAAAALMLARARRCDLEFYVNDDHEPNAVGILHALRAMFEGLRGARLIEQPWQDWSAFRRTVGSMDLCFQLSHTETFNITSADAVAEGVPCVVTPAVDWAPKQWQVDTDAVEDAARLGAHLLDAPEGAHDGLIALQRYVADATARWLAYLDGSPTAAASAA